MWHGRNEPPTEMRELRAGPLSCLLDGVDLRYVRNGETELVRRLFAAIRDAAWGTVAPQISDLEIEDGGDSFRVSFEAFHEAADLRFRWHGLLSGSAEGVLECRMDGAAETDCRYCRIGFPHDATAGQAIVQSVRLSVDGRAASRAKEETTRIRLGGHPAGRLPTVGLGMASDGGRLDDREAQLVAALRPTHLRVDLDLAYDGWRGEDRKSTRLN